MGPPNPARVARRFQAAYRTPFGPDQVEALRKDVLTLTKNVDRVKTEEDYNTLREGVRTWAAGFDDTVKGVLDNITLSIRVWLTGSTSFPDSPYDREQEASWFKYWDKKLREETWGLYITLRSPPMRYYDWPTEGKKWGEKVKRYARKAWAAFAEFLDWLKARNVGTQRTEKRVEKVRLEGFNLTLVAYDPSEEFAAAFLERLKVALGIYRSRASKVLPALLRAQIPLQIHFDCGLDEGGEYLGKYIKICANSSDPKKIAHTLAHEMGHHLFRAYLSGDARDFWRTAVRQDYGDLNLNDLLKAWKEGESSFDLYDRLALQDPVLALQVFGVFYGHSRSQERPDWHTRRELEEFLRGGGNAVWSVPTHPISAYASKNEEEAFCETVGLLVAHGSQAVDPLVREWLKVILPDVKTARLSLLR